MSRTSETLVPAGNPTPSLSSFSDGRITLTTCLALTTQARDTFPPAHGGSTMEFDPNQPADCRVRRQPYPCCIPRVR